jgi:hypothetical protein
LALASGALWFAGVTAILLFRSMPDNPAAAGLLAADIFMASYVAASVPSFLGVLFAPVGRPIGFVLLLALLAQVFGIVPALRQHGAGWPATFASLHATASVLHLVLAVATIWWAVLLVRYRRLQFVGLGY